LPDARSREFHQVSSADEVATVAEEARAGGRLGLDTEFLREKTYRAKLCLVQVSTTTGIYLLDPLAGYDLDPIAALIADPEVEVIVHAGRQDFELFYESHGAVPQNVFDVQLAAGFAGLGASLPYGRLVEALTGAVLTKGESYTDWCRRPLSASQLDYAADDVRFLIDMSDKLRRKLTKVDRLGWALGEMASYESEEAYRTDPEETWRRVSGRGSLSGRQLGILREVAAWREREAQTRDIPRGWVVKDQSLIEIARKGPKSPAALKDMRGINPREAERSGRAIIESVQRADSAAPIETGRSLPKTAVMRARTLSGLADAVIRSRCDAADVAPELVTTRGELEALLADAFSGGPRPENHRLLQGWRRELAGEAVLALADGRIAVRSIGHPPYIEEVPIG
jgi:ribonuclease D